MSENKKVLIIDDEIDLCLLLKSYFLRKNYEVYFCHTLQEGLSFIKTIKPSILFLDNNLPDGTGWGTAPQIADDYPEMHINMISAFHPQSPTMPDNARYSIIEKPIRLADLDKHLVNA